MKVYSELNLTEFDFWSGAKGHSFTYTELKEIESQLDDLYPNGTSETHINNLFWFDPKWLCEIIGIDFEEYLERD